MKRRIEKLAQESKEKQEEFAQKLKELRDKAKDIPSSKTYPQIQKLSSEFEPLFKSREDIHPLKRKIKFLSSLSRKLKLDYSQESFNRDLLHVLQKIHSALDQNDVQMKRLLSSLTDLTELNVALADSRDREWETSGRKHAEMLSKNLESRLNKLAELYDDVNLVMKKFLLLKENLTRLLDTLEAKQMPSPSQVREILKPIEDWEYVRFENRFRGSGEEVKKQQASYVSYFQEGGKVLDLGCGRGEFLELLEKNAVEAMGVDINEQMVDICLEKGLKCQKGDLLERLSEFEDGSLSGVFSSQVVEHLPPAYFMRLIELSYFKLAPSGIIVLETLNPASVFCLSQIYFLDFTHQNPIHPQMLQFLMEKTGFEEVEIKYSAPLEELRLQNLPGTDESTLILNRNIDSLNNLLYAPPNYAAIGKKPQ